MGIRITHAVIALLESVKYDNEHGEPNWEDD